MSGLKPDPSYDMYKQCQALYDEGKVTKLTRLGLQNLMGPNMPRYLQIKTLVLLVGAENGSWEQAEEHRVRAERVYASTRELMVQNLPNMTAAAKAEDEAGMKQLREISTT